MTEQQKEAVALSDWPAEPQYKFVLNDAQGRPMVLPEPQAGIRGGILFPKTGITKIHSDCVEGDMTAIISAFTTGGFIIGADGRTLLKNEIVCENTRKIFHFKYRHINVVYIWCGTVRHTNESGEITFDLDAITNETLDSVARLNGLSFTMFIEKCRQGIYDRICRSPGVKKITNSDGESDSRARMLLNGYFNGIPFSTEFYLRDKDRIRIDADEIHMPLVSPSRNIFSGCGEQNEKYRYIAPSTVEDSIRLVTDFIQACIDNSEPDCFKVGGRRHISYLNSDDFSWIDEPEKMD